VVNQKDITLECKHTWIIDSPNGPVSEGVCELCGIKQEFRNSVPISGWDRSGAQKKKSS
jgi:hypothetical protein